MASVCRGRRQARGERLQLVRKAYHAKVLWWPRERARVFRGRQGDLAKLRLLGYRANIMSANVSLDFGRLTNRIISNREETRWTTGCMVVTVLSLQDSVNITRADVVFDDSADSLAQLTGMALERTSSVVQCRGPEQAASVQRLLSCLAVLRGPTATAVTVYVQGTARPWLLDAYGKCVDRNDVEVIYEGRYLGYINVGTAKHRLDLSHATESPNNYRLALHDDPLAYDHAVATGKRPGVHNVLVTDERDSKRNTVPRQGLMRALCDYEQKNHMSLFTNVYVGDSYSDFDFGAAPQLPVACLSPRDDLVSMCKRAVAEGYYVRRMATELGTEGSVDSCSVSVGVVQIGRALVRITHTTAGVLIRSGGHAGAYVDHAGRVVLVCAPSSLWQAIAMSTDGRFSATVIVDKTNASELLEACRLLGRISLDDGAPVPPELNVDGEDAEGFLSTLNTNPGVVGITVPTRVPVVYDDTGCQCLGCYRLLASLYNEAHSFLPQISQPHDPRSFISELVFLLAKGLCNVTVDIADIRDLLYSSYASLHLRFDQRKGQRS